MAFNLYFVRRELYWSELLRNGDKGKPTFIEHPFYAGHCLWQPLLTCTMPLSAPYFTNPQREKWGYVSRAANGTQDFLTHSLPLPWGQDCEQEHQDCVQAPFPDFVQLLPSMTPKLQSEDTYTCHNFSNLTFKVQPLRFWECCSFYPFFHLYPSSYLFGVLIHVLSPSSLPTSLP